MPKAPKLVVPSDAVAEMITDTVEDGMKAVLLREAVAKVMVKQGELLVPGEAVEVKLTEAMIVEGVSCDMEFVEDGFVKASFPVSAVNDPAPYDLMQVRDRTLELLKLVYPENGVLHLSPAENVKVVELPGFKSLQLVCSADEERTIRAKFGGGCGGNCKCAAAQDPAPDVAGAPPLSVLRSPGGGTEREPEEGERCKE